MEILTTSGFVNRVESVFCWAKGHQVTHSELLEYVQKHVWAELSRKHGKRNVYSAYMQGYVQGLVDANRQNLWVQMEFCYSVDGVLYSTSRNTDKRKTSEIDGSILCKSEGAHYWAGTDKRFT